MLVFQFWRAPEKTYGGKKLQYQNMLVWVVAACQLWRWFPHWRCDLGTLMKCVCKVLIYHPPKNRHSIMIWRCCSRPWMLWGSAPKWKHKLSGRIGWPQVKRFQHQDGFQKAYELIAKHAPLFEVRFCDLRIAPVTKHLLVQASDFFNPSVLLNYFYAQCV